MTNGSTQMTPSSKNRSIQEIIAGIKQLIETTPTEEREKWQHEYKTREAQKELENLKRTYKRAGLNERHTQYTFDNFEVSESNKKAYEAVKEYACNFERSITASGLYICGPYGTGKTHLACALCSHLILNSKSFFNVSCTFDTMIGISQKIKAEFGKNTGFDNSTLDQMADTGLLVIDDLGKEKPTAWAMENLYYIIDQRYTNYKPIVITSNYGLQGLSNRLTVDGNDDVVSSIISRLQEITKGVLITGEDWRKTHKTLINPTERPGEDDYESIGIIL